MKYYDGDKMIRYEIDSDGDGYFDIINEKLLSSYSRVYTYWW